MSSSISKCGSIEKEIDGHSMVIIRSGIYVVDVLVKSYSNNV
jgi:hypothetical protein